MKTAVGLFLRSCLLLAVASGSGAGGLWRATAAAASDSEASDSANLPSFGLGVPPFLLFVNPATGAKGVSANATITFTFTMAMATDNRVAWSANVNTADLVCTQSADKTQLTCTPNTGWPVGLITWDLSSFKGADGTPILALSLQGGFTTGPPAPGTLSISDALPVLEGNTGTSPMTFTITLSAPSAQFVTVHYSTQDGTATAGQDYIPVTDGVVVFSPGQTSKSIAIQMIGDTVVEPDEFFFVTLSNPQNATIDKAVALGTILDDDTAPILSIGNVTVTEGNSGTTNAVFTVQRSGNLGQPFTLNYSTSDGTAAAGSDYVVTSGALNFAPGETSKTITVAVIGDLNIEGDETFFVTLGSSISPNLLTAKATIVNDDGVPLVSVNDASILEGNIGTTLLSFPVILSAPSAVPVTVGYSTTDGTAVAGSDYAATSGTLVIPAGQTSGSITVQIIGDTLTEPDETFFVNLTNASNAAILRDKATGTIRNDDSTATISIGNAILNEGQSGTSIMSFQVTLTGGTGASVSVNYATLDGTATAGSDYIPVVNGSLLFTANQTNRTIDIAIIGDTIFEPDENFFVQLSQPSGGIIGNGQATGLIQNDDSPPTLSVGGAAVKEGDSGTVNALLTVSLTGASQQPVTVDFFTTALTAAADVDFVSTSGTLTFPSGTSSLTVTVPVIGDTVPESDETFVVNLRNPVNATLVNAIGLGTIRDDDSGPSLSISDAVVFEGNSGTVDAVFTVSLSSPATLPVTVHVSTSDLTATAGIDYDPTPVPTDLLFQPGGPTSYSVVVRVIGDVANEPDESFYVSLSNPTGGATLANGRGIGTILNDDVRPNIFINDVTVTEGNSGTTPATFTLQLSALAAQNVTVDYFTQDVTAHENSDYIPISQTTLTIPAGTLSQTITVLVIGDTVEEPDESFAVNLINASSNAQLANPVGHGIIRNDDFVPRLSIGDASVTEGDSGTVNAVFPLTLSVAAPSLTTIAYSTANGTATAGSDYVASNGVVVFPAGTTTGSITVAVNGDITGEPNETFFVNLGQVTGAQVIPSNTQGTGTILNDDAPSAPGALSISDAIPVVEGNSGTRPAVFTVILSKPSLEPVRVNFATSDGLAKAGPDYVLSNGVLVFLPGETSKTISVSVIGDLLVESDEFFLLNLSNPLGATIDIAQALGVIHDDDAPVNAAPTVIITSPANGATFTAPSNVLITSVATDIDGSIAKVEFFQGNTQLGEATSSPYNFTWSNVAAGNYTLTSRATDNLGATTTSSPVNIVVKQAGNLPPTLSIDDAAVTEGNIGTVVADFRVSLSAASSLPVTVDYSTASDTALAGSDFVPTSGTLIFAPGETTKTISVAVVGDTIAEATESFFFVNLSNASNASIFDSQGVGFITDDDSIPTIIITDAAVTEGDSGTIDAVFNVSLSAISGQIVTVDFATADDTAKAGSDYQVVRGTLTFNPGETNKTIVVPVINDLIGEPTESFFVNLTNVVNAVLTDSQSKGTITDNDSLPRLNINDFSITEGNSGTTTAVLTVSLSAASPLPVSVNWATANGTASAPSDYLANSGTLIFATGQTAGTIAVVVNGDTINEADEMFFVNLSNAVNAGISVGQGVGTILDDDHPTSTNAIPTIVSQPKDQEIPLGGIAKFSVSATGQGALAFQWRFEGARIIGATNSELDLPKITQSDVGNYTVEVTDANGSVTSDPAKLLIFQDSDGDALSDNYEKGITRYKWIKGNFTYVEAKADAEGRGGHLVTITSEAEWQSISANIPGGISDTFWLGLFRPQGTTNWQWLTGEPFTYSRWSPGQPEGGAGLGDVAGQGLDGLWGDGYKDQIPPDRHPYILEYGYYSDPNNRDTDGDGLSDGDEVNKYGTFPSFADSNQNGISDKDEITPQFRSIKVSTFSGCRLIFGGLVGANYSVETSSNLVDWAHLTNLTVTNATATLVDSSATNQPLRFYRAQQFP